MLRVPAGGASGTAGTALSVSIRREPAKGYHGFPSIPFLKPIIYTSHYTTHRVDGAQQRTPLAFSRVRHRKFLTEIPVTTY
jgi:hypothetical protein